MNKSLIKVTKHKVAKMFLPLYDLFCLLFAVCELGLRVKQFRQRDARFVLSAAAYIMMNISSVLAYSSLK